MNLSPCVASAFRRKAAAVEQSRTLHAAFRLKPEATLDIFTGSEAAATLVNCRKAAYPPYRRARFPWYKLTFVCRSKPPPEGGTQRPEVPLFPDLSVLWVIFFVLVLTILLDRLLLRPLQRVMHQREDATRSARALAERSALEAREAAAEFERKTTAARAEVYRQMDDMRRTALAERTEILAQTRAQAEQEIAAASAQLQADSEEARRRLAADAEALGAEAAERILGRRAS